MLGEKLEPIGCCVRILLLLPLCFFIYPLGWTFSDQGFPSLLFITFRSIMANLECWNISLLQGHKGVVVIPVKISDIRIWRKRLLYSKSFFVVFSVFHRCFGYFRLQSTDEVQWDRNAYLQLLLRGIPKTYFLSMYIYIGVIDDTLYFFRIQIRDDV